MLDEETIARLNTRLENFERETSNQIVVAIFSKLPPDAEIAQYSTQVLREWKVGQAGKDNGVVLFIFKDDHKVFIATGRGMEGALPDFTCKQIIHNEIVPRFKAGDFAGGIDAGVTAIISATKGEYKGNGKTHGDHASETSSGVPLLFLLGFVIFFITVARRASSQRGVLVNRGGYVPLGGGFFGGGSGGGWGGGGGGGGFSGGGGSSGGGGAGGSW